MIEVENLTKRFGRVVAIDDISFHVNRGEVVGLLGPNGAGKTTTMRILACYMLPTAGRVAIGGRNVIDSSLDVRRRIGYLPENAPLYPEMRVKDYLEFRGRLRGLGSRKIRSRMKEVVALCELGSVYRTVIGRLSGGFRHRVALADSILHNPEALILDEPTQGLDPIQRRNFRELLKQLCGTQTILLSTHILSEAVSTCQRLLIMNKGKIVASDAPERLAGLGKSSEQYVAEIRGPVNTVIEKLKTVPGIRAVFAEERGEWSRFRLECESGGDVRAAVFDEVVRNGWTLRDLRAEQKNMEDVFASLTKGEEA